MNDTALVEYLLQKHAECVAKSDEAFYVTNEDVKAVYYEGQADLISIILREKFGVKICLKDGEYIVCDGTCDVKVRKENACETD